MKATWPFIVSLYFVCLPFSAQAEARIQFVMDLSISMKKTIRGVSKFEAAKKALAQALKNTPPTVATALRVYGHRHTIKDKSASCLDSELVVPFATNNAKNILSSLNRFQPKGYTPLTYTLEAALEGYDAESSQISDVVVLLSDGEETCGGDPVAVVSELRKKGIQVKIHTIGYLVEREARSQLSRLANLTGGEYFEVKKLGQLKFALVDAVSASLGQSFERSKWSKPVPGDLGGLFDAGSTKETALKIEAGNYPHNYLALSDKQDQFIYQGQTGEKYYLRARKKGNSKSVIDVRVLTSDGELITNSKLVDDSEFKSDVFDLGADGQCLIDVSLSDSERGLSSPIEYEFALVGMVSLKTE